MLLTLLELIQIATGCLLILIVLMQPGSGLGRAFGGGMAQQIFGGAGTRRLLMRATAVFAAIFVITTVLIAWPSSAHAP